MSGRIIREGHLPLWNPYIWSGNPLLGGLNAGSLYPGTLVFAVLPPVAAWVVNLLLVYWAAGLGMYALARHYRLAPLAAAIGAATFAFAGSMSGQLVHLPIIQGVAWLPLLVLAELRLAWAVLGVGPVRADGDLVADESDRPRSPWPWVVLLAVVFGLVLLTGEPRGMADAGIVSVVVFVWLAVRPYRGAVAVRARLRYLALTVLAGVWGVALGAVQLLPGLRFISSSQRSAVSYSFFGTGSLRPSWSMLMVVPDLFGGDGLFHQPVYFNNYNLPEVTGYVGLLPLVAAFALLTLSFGRRRAGQSADWGPWIFLVVLGFLLSFGSFTPLGGLLGHIPFYDRLRLQSRNLAIVDLGFAMLLAFWADRLLAGRTRRETSGWRRWVTMAPLVVAAGVCVTALAVPYDLDLSQGTTSFGATLGAQLRVWIAAQLVVVAAVTALVLGWRRLPGRWRATALVAVLAVDLLLFSFSTSTGLTAGNVTLQPTPAAASAVFGSHGRFAIFDTTALNTDVLSEVGQPDLNVFAYHPSVQGYGSIVDGTYGNSTGTHTLDNLNQCALERGDFATLRLASLMSLPQSISIPLSASGAAQPGQPQPTPLTQCGGTVEIPLDRSFFFGRPLTVQSVQLVSMPSLGGRGGSAQPPAPAVSFLDANGAVIHPKVTVTQNAKGWRVVPATPLSAGGLVVDGHSGSLPSQQFGDAVVTATGDARYSLDGILQDPLTLSGWRFTGFWNQYALFRHTVRPSPVWIARPAPGAQVRHVQSTDWGTEIAQVSTPRPATVVWSETYQEGWHVQLDSANGTVHKTVGVDRDGLIQSVHVPPGSWQVTFLYRPRGLNTGILATTIGSVLLVASAVVFVVGRRRRRMPRRWLGRHRVT